MKKQISSVLLALITAILTTSLRAVDFRESVTIDDLVGRFQILVVTLAPDGRRVAYLTVKGLPLENLYEIALCLLDTDGKSQPIVLGQYRLTPDETFERDTGGLRKAVSQFTWSPDGKHLVYTTHAGADMEVRIRTIDMGTDRTLLKGFHDIEIGVKSKQLEFTAIHPVGMSAETQAQPEDRALLVKDGYRFYGPLTNPKTRGKFIIQKWNYSWGEQAPTEVGSPEAPSYLGFPDEWAEGRPDSNIALKQSTSEKVSLKDQTPSPDTTRIAFVEEAMRDLQSPGFSYRVSRIIVKQTRNGDAQPLVLVPYGSHEMSFTILGWSPDGKRLYYLCLAPQFSSVNSVTLEGRTREIWKDESGLTTGPGRISEDGNTAVFVRSTNVTPDELLKVDLQTGSSTVLVSPNAVFQTKTLPTVRFMPIEGISGDFYGRLYLPVGDEKGKRYPLVFTNYVSGPGFYASVGDEVPILTLTAHGIAVFALNSRGVNEASQTGDFRMEISRVQRPLRAMEWVRRKLTEQGIIDPERCGLTGLSYGAEIAMYAYWKSTIFRAISVASTSWEPMNYVLAGMPYSKFLDKRGFALPDDGAYTKWKELSAGLNARSDLPPLLIQSSDDEEYFGTIETWFRLRRTGAQVEWYEYPNEGHVKRSPDDKWWVYQRNLDWLRFWLKDEEDPDPTKAEQYTRWRELRNLQNANEKKVPSELVSH
jgi:dipeptidyl aminopeptidase/acylaminoacyl peptidase